MRTLKVERNLKERSDWGIQSMLFQEYIQNRLAWIYVTISSEYSSTSKQSQQFQHKLDLMKK
jgi:hypothetical protein